MFKDRSEAGKLLAKALEKYINDKVVVLALPRGGVVVGYEVAKTLKAPLDVVVTRKIGHPHNPEYAIGVVDEHGLFLGNEKEVESVDGNWLKEEILHQRQEAGRRVALYRGEQKILEIKDSVVIIVDDGMATGLSIRLAVRSIKKQSPAKIVVAVPVAPSDAIHFIYNEGVDEIIVLELPEEFLGAVGSHYAYFGQVEDNEVINLLKKC